MDIQFFKNKLDEEKKALEAELNNLGTLDPETGVWAPKADPVTEEDMMDKNDMGDRNEEFSSNADILNELEIRYKSILKALAKIEKADGSYGKCEVSGEMIEEDRLAANPAATTCKSHME